ncbi:MULTISPECIES: hypothetical protein [Micromonospora]|uniref:hypothetical protein n=1 Tax=Micromonospora TaxID=1873 RepID=UPI001B35BFCD|nr:hypothetical protein [Micromonospora sp. M61]MBQ0982652.1 hypothetical protein [Micromonospora sp. M61]WTI20037.1 hypothetical protein OG886_24230 [Micromonospora zamorensis]
MSDAYVVGDPDGLSPLLIALRDTIARELHAQLALRGEQIELADLPEVSYQVTVQVERTLRAWRPARRAPTESGFDEDRDLVDRSRTVTGDL